MLQGTNLYGDASTTLAIALTDKYGYAMLASCTGAASSQSTAGVFQHGCLLNRTDSGTGTNALYQNTGSVAVPSWTLLDTGVEQDATVLVDSNGVVSVAITTVSSAVNGLLVTNSATGAVSANAVILSPGAPSGADAAISITLRPLGVTGLTTIGLTNGTGTITVGSSSGAQTLVLGGGAGISTVQIAGGSAANVITIGNVQTAGSIAIGETMTSGTISIGGGSAVNTGGIIIGSSGATTGATLIRGGTGTGAITLTPGTAGTIIIGATAGTGAITLGSSSTTQTVNIGTGAGVSTVNVGTGAAANVITVGAASSKVTLNGSAVTSYQSINYQGTEGGANNAITCNLVDAAGNNITLAAGLKIAIKLAHTLQAGANTLALNGGSTKAILSHRNTANNIGTAYAVGGVIELLYDGTQWQDLSQ